MTKVKICGLMNPVDARVACELGADFVGALVGAEVSPRNLTLEEAKRVFGEIPAEIKRVVVTMPKKASDVLKVAQEIKPDYIQLHSSLPLEELKKLRKSCKSGLILVIPIDPEAKDASRLVENAREVEELADYLLLDTKGPRGGGTGAPHDWTISREIRDSVDKPVFLAGGLKPSNVLQAIRAVNPYGVDVSSGVESKVGKKDMRLIAEFIKKVKGMPENVRG